jgi:hypothetical protein
MWSALNGNMPMTRTCCIHWNLWGQSTCPASNPHWHNVRHFSTPIRGDGPRLGLLELVGYVWPIRFCGCDVALYHILVLYRLDAHSLEPITLPHIFSYCSMFRDSPFDITQCFATAASSPYILSQVLVSIRVSASCRASSMIPFHPWVKSQATQSQNNFRMRKIHTSSMSDDLSSLVCALNFH